MTAIKAVAVYCGALHGAEPKYRDAAYEFGRQLAQSNIDLVFGGGSVGLMGVVSQGVADAGGRAIGVITRMLVHREAANGHLSRLEVVESMHERKQRMFELADAFVALPGGVGTLDETIEVITWRQLGLHDKPIVIVDHDGYWQPLENLMRHVVRAGFALPSLHGLYTVVPGIGDVINTLQAAPPPAIPDKPEKT
jgi:uncharacterized protein (TIGR00730 family)